MGYAVRMIFKEVPHSDLWVESEADRCYLREFGFPAAHLAEALNFWHAAMENGDLPDVSVIDPLKIPTAALPWTDLIEVESQPLRFQIRLWGTAVVQAVGHDLKGTYLDEAGMEDGIRRLTAVVEKRIPYFARIPLTWHIEEYRHRSHYCSLGLPFRDISGSVTRILCFLDFET